MCSGCTRGRRTRPQSADTKSVLRGTQSLRRVEIVETTKPRRTAGSLGRPSSPISAQARRGPTRLRAVPVADRVSAMSRRRGPVGFSGHVVFARSERLLLRSSQRMLQSTLEETSPGPQRPECQRRSRNSPGPPPADAVGSCRQALRRGCRRRRRGSRRRSANRAELGHGR